MNKVQNMLIVELITNITFIIIFLIFRELFLDTSLGFFIVVVIGLTSALVFYSWRQKYNFNYKVSENFVQNVFDNNILVRKFLIIYLIFLIFISFLAFFSGGFQSKWWLMLLIPLFLPFYLVMLKEQWQEASKL